MTEISSLLIPAILIGAGATIVMDLWGLVAARLFKFTPPSYAPVGRWIGHMPRGQFIHDAIARAAPVPGEAVIGWTAHYAIGIAYALILLKVYGLAWALAPQIVPALTIAWATLAAPFLVMQPGMGAGLFASRTPNPMQARLRSFLNHTAFGIGLYAAALIANALLSN